MENSEIKTRDKGAANRPRVSWLAAVLSVVAIVWIVGLDVTAWHVFLALGAMVIINLAIINVLYGNRPPEFRKRLIWASMIASVLGVLLVVGLLFVIVANTPKIGG